MSDAPLTNEQVRALREAIKRIRDFREQKVEIDKDIAIEWRSLKKAGVNVPLARAALARLERGPDNPEREAAIARYVAAITDAPRARAREADTPDLAIPPMLERRHKPAQEETENE